MMLRSLNFSFFARFSALMLAVMLTGAVPLSASTALDKATAQFVEFYTSNAHAGFSLNDTNEAQPDVNLAVSFARTLKPDGSWPDIDYASKARSSWPLSLHVGRVAAMAIVAKKQPEHRTRLLEATHCALGFWIEHDFRCPNWWYNNIGVPKRLGIAGLVLGDDLKPEERQYLVQKVLPRAKIGMTGQNRLWLAGNTVMLGLLSKNEGLVTRAAETIWKEVKITTGEGLQPDFSFHQHGPQQQFGNYGWAYAIELSRWANILRDTSWAMPAERREIFRNYMLEGQNWVSWRGVMDVGACGRQFMPGTPAQKTDMIRLAMAECRYFDPAKKAEYDAFVARNQPGAANDLVGNRFFWRSDYGVHRLKEFAMMLKMSSNRVIASEVVNSENLSGTHLGDGALWTYRSGREYEEIFPAWDWRRLPGTTTAQGKLGSAHNVRVKRDFVGGVSDGQTGVAVLDYDRDGVAARKAYFFTTDGVVCLGAGITSTRKEAVRTTLEQNLLKGPVSGQRGSVAVPLTSGVHSRLSWAEHAGLRYTFLEPAAATLDAGPRTGNWNKVFRNPATPREDVTLPVFDLAIEHGVNPENATYAYAISLAGTAPAARVQENAPARQVVTMGGNRIGVVFWQAGEAQLSPNDTLRVSDPCVVLFDALTRELHLAEPTQRLASIQVSLNGKTAVTPLPEKGLAGSTVLVKF